MSDIAVGTPMFSRTDALQQFLASLPQYVSTVYIADNGHTDEHQHIYDKERSFALSVLDIEYDAGIGACRHAIAQAVTEPYLFVCDCDMELTRDNDLRVLRSILETHPDIGAVSGWLNEGNTVRTGARNLHDHDGTIIKNIRNQPDIEQDPVPFARFEFIPQAGLYRTAIFDSYCYDPAMFNSEHLDFYLGQKQADEWEFASTPAVIVQHHRNIDPEYRESKRGKNHVDFDLMDQKWGVQWAVPGPRSDWVTTRHRPLKERLFNLYRKATPPQIWMPTRKLLRKMGLQ